MTLGVSDVVEYRNNIFLPAMAKYESRMAKWTEYSNGNFIRIAATLKEGEKEIIPNFQDESCFHANEFKSSAW